jgi:hypothetical protein
MAVFDEIRRVEPDYFEKYPDFAAEYLARSRAALRSGTETTRTEPFFE